LTEEDLRALVARHMPAANPPLCPELRTREASRLVPVWEEAEQLAKSEVEPPYWAYSWPGSQALARHVLDGGIPAGRTVLDLGTGNGLAAIAAVKAGAARVIANDIDPAALWMARRNSEENGVALELSEADLLANEPPVPPVEVILAGDLFYARAMAARVEPWLREAARRGALVLVGDPGRAYLPREGLLELAAYEVPVPRDIEGVDSRRVAVLKMGV
jgi:predicted nicotinamide N-methyase